MTADILTIESGRQRLRLMPNLGGSIASWDWNTASGWIPLLRPWDEVAEDRYSFACFPLVPWSNRITQGGFEQDGVFHPIHANRSGETFPIHGDGWLQSWKVDEHTASTARLSLRSQHFDHNPYAYESTEDFLLLPDGLSVELTVTHLGDRPLPYGLGLHPYFPRDASTRFQAKADGVWLSGADPIPIGYTTEFPTGWDYNQPATLPLDAPMIDNCFNGWDGYAVIEYPDRGLSVTMEMADCNGYSLMYRPPGLPYFCFEPITHPIDAFHMEGRPGLAVLSQGESLTLRVRLMVAALR